MSKNTPLTHQQAMRYNRQILLPGFDLERQETLQASTVVIIGMGGLGCACAQYLASSGVGHLILIDSDQVELTNLPRQVLYCEQDIGTRKVEAAKAALARLNPDCTLEALAIALENEADQRLPASCDILLDCTDNLTSRKLINRLSLERQIPLVSAAAIQMEGQITSFIPGPHSPCYECVASLFGEVELSCVENGVLAPVVGIMGTMQALEAIKILCGFGSPSVGQLNLYDALSGQWQQFRVPKRPDCPQCGGRD